MHIINISDAKASLSQLIKMIQETNEPVIIGKAGKPVAVLSAFKESDQPRKLGGSWEGKVTMHDSFDSAEETDDALTNSFCESTIFPKESPDLSSQVIE